MCTIDVDGGGIAALDPDDFAEHLLWEWSARPDLIHAVGKPEWCRHQPWTARPADDWAAEHGRIVPVRDGDLAGL